MAAKLPTFAAAEALEKKGNLARAAEVYEKVAASSPDDRTLLRLATVRERLGEAAAAAAAYQQLAGLHQRLGFAAKATSALRQAVRLSPGEPDLARALAEQLEAEGKTGDAMQVWETAGRAAAQRGDEKLRLQMLERMATLDGGVPLALSLADALEKAGRRAEALTRLRAIARRLGEEESLADQLSVLERVLKLDPADREGALRAGQIAVLLGEPRRGLVAVRAALDHFLEDAELVSCAARAMDAMGQKIRGTLLHREAARRLEKAGDAAAAYDEWRAVLAFDPADGESLAHMHSLSKQGSPTPAPAPRPAPPIASKTPTVEVRFDELVSAEQVEVDVRVEPARSFSPTPVLPERLFVLPAEAAPTAVRPVEAEAAPAEVSRALVLGDGPEAAWIERALAELDIAAVRVGRDEMAAALERAETQKPQLVFAPPTLAQAWKDAGSWLVTGPASVPRIEARSRLAEAGVPTLPCLPVQGAAELKRAADSWGVPFELAGPFELPMPVPSASPSAMGYHLTLAREKLGASLVAQPAPNWRVEVMVAGDGTEAIGLASWDSTVIEGIPALESPSTGGEPPVLALAERCARALRVKGIAVVVLAQVGTSFVFESFRLAWGPGGLASEARTSVPLVELAVTIARGGKLPATIERRGVALAASATGSLVMVANLRVEPSADGTQSFVCAHAIDRAQAVRRLVRALKPGTAPGPASEPRA